jgi:hypothetical protein
MNLSNSLKSTSIVFGILFTSLATSQATVTFYIKQVQEGANGEDGLSTDVYIENAELLKENKSSEGTHSALMEVGQYGSTFYLYVQGIDGPDGPPILLDQKFIGQYVATAEIEITSVDPYVPTRTRANESYSVKVTSSNQQWTSAHLSGTAPEISWDPLNVVLSATYEKQEVDGSIISSGIIDLDTTDEAVNSTTLALVAGNEQEFTYSYTGTNIPADDDPVEATVPRASDTYLMGKEKFVVLAESDVDNNGDPIHRQVGSSSIQIWPRAQGKIAGLVQGDRITRSMPDVNIYLYDLYPNSTSYATIYQGEANLEGNLIPVYTSFKLGPYNRAEPIGTSNSPAEIPVTNWDKYITDDGFYTLEVSTITPFNNGNPERILAVTFYVDRKIEVVGSTTSSE